MRSEVNGSLETKPLELREWQGCEIAIVTKCGTAQEAAVAPGTLL